MRKNFGVKPWLVPNPVLIIATWNDAGQADAMNAAWGGLYEGNQIQLCLSEGHITTRNILKQKAFTVSFGDAAHVKACDYVGVVSFANEPDKLVNAGFTAKESAFVHAPIIQELPLCLECRLVKVTEDGNVIGEIVNVSADESILDAAGKPDLSLMEPIVFDPCANTYRVVKESIAKAFSCGFELK